MNHVFISYVHENSSTVDRLCNELEKRGITIWLDRNDILPGVLWKDAIRRAISNGDCFLACFSKEYISKSRSYMNEEILLAIEELRQHQQNNAWFIPVLLSGEIPDTDIGAGKTLLDIQHIELNQRNWDYGIEQIVKSIRYIDGSFHQEGSIAQKLDPASPSFYAGFLSGQSTTSKQREEYIKNAITFQWPLLGLSVEFRREVKEVLLSLMLDKDFERWERCVSLYLSLGDGLPIEEAEKLNEKLNKVRRRADETLIRHLEVVGASVDTRDDLYKNPPENVEDLEYSCRDSFQGLEFLEEMIKNKDVQIRRAAASQLQNFRLWKSVDLLRKLIDDPDSGVCIESLHSLAILVNWGNGFWIFHILDEPVPNLGYPYEDSQYKTIHKSTSSKSTKSIYDLLWNSLMENYKSNKDAILLIGILGDETDLLLLINSYLKFVPLNNEDVRRNYFNAMTLLDERIFAPKVYYPIYKEAFWNRWWNINSSGGLCDHDHGREYYKNLVKKD